MLFMKENAALFTLLAWDFVCVLTGGIKHDHSLILLSFVNDLPDLFDMGMRVGACDGFACWWSGVSVYLCCASFVEAINYSFGMRLKMQRSERGLKRILTTKYKYNLWNLRINHELSDISLDLEWMCVFFSRKGKSIPHPWCSFCCCCNMNASYKMTLSGTQNLRMNLLISHFFRGSLLQWGIQRNLGWGGRWWQKGWGGSKQVVQFCSKTQLTQLILEQRLWLLLLLLLLQCVDPGSREGDGSLAISWPGCQSQVTQDLVQGLVPLLSPHALLTGAVTLEGSGLDRGESKQEGLAHHQHQAESQDDGKVVGFWHLVLLVLCLARWCHSMCFAWLCQWVFSIFFNSNCRQWNFSLFFSYFEITS